MEFIKDILYAYNARTVRSSDHLNGLSGPEKIRTINKIQIKVNSADSRTQANWVGAFAGIGLGLIWLAVAPAVFPTELAVIAIGVGIHHFLRAKVIEANTEVYRRELEVLRKPSDPAPDQRSTETRRIS